MRAGGGGNRRDALALGGALAVHLAIVLAARSVRLPAVENASTASNAAAEETVEVTMEVARRPPSARAPLSAAPSEGNAAPAASLRGSGGVALLTAPVAAAETPSGGEPATERGTEPDDAWSFSSSRIATDVGAARFGASAAATTHDVDPAASGLAATNALLEGISAHDIASGTSRGGPLLAAVEEAAHGADAPSLGVAVFDITVSRNGAPQVSLVDAKDDAAAWTKLGAAIAAATVKRQATVHLPDRATAIRVRIRVEAVDRLADGTDIGVTGKTRKDLHRGTLVRTGDPEDLPHAEVAHKGRICSVRAGINPFSPYIDGSCSPENALPPVRRVAARIVSETRL